MTDKIPILVFILFLATILRLLPAMELMKYDRIYFAGPDSYSFMWNVRYAAEHFPGMLLFDKYQGFPDGANVNFSPLFVFLLASVSWLAGLGSPSPGLIEMTGAISPVIIGTITSIVVYSISRRFLDETEALVSTLFFSVVPAQVSNTLFGFADTNSIEPLLASVFMLLILKCLEKRTMVYAVVPGFFLSVAMLIWQGSLLFTGMLFLFAFIMVLSDIRDKNIPDISWFFITLVSFVAVLLSLKTAGIWGMGDSFHLLLNLYISMAGAVFFILLYFMGRLFIRKNMTAGLFLTASFGMILVATVILYFVAPESVRGYFMSMGRNFFYKDPLYQFISEMQPLLFRNGRMIFQDPTFMLTIFFWLFPAALFFFLRDKEMDKTKKQLFFAWTIVNFLLAALHLRFAGIFAINLSILFGYCFGLIRNQKARTITLAVSLLIILASVFPSYANLRRHTPFNLIPITNDLFPALSWMRENTPKGGDYGVLSRWDFGYWIVYIGERPAVAVNSGVGIGTSAKFLVSRDEAGLVELLKKNKVRYIIISDFAQALPSMAELAGENRKDFEFTLSPDESVNPSPEYFNALTTRLFLNDGNSFAENQKGLHHFRLVYESPNPFPVMGFGQEVKRVKIFEFVNGAVLKGKTLPNVGVRVSADLISNQGRPFTHRNLAISDKDGFFEIIVPYATEDSSYQLRALPYAVSYGMTKKTVSIKEHQVINGETIYVSGQ